MHGESNSLSGSGLDHLFQKGLRGLNQYMADIHNYQKNLENKVSSLEKSGFNSEEVKKLKEFKTHLQSEGVKPPKILRYLSSLTTLQPHIEFKLTEIPEKKQVKKVVARINGNQIKEQEYSVYTLKEFKLAIRRYYQFYTGEEDPSFLDFMTTNIKRKDEKFTSVNELPLPKDIKDMVKTRERLRDQTLIFFTWASGGRIGEVLNVKWQDVTFTSQGVKVKFRESKSMKREIPFKESSEYLNRWKKKSPASRPKDYVFCKLPGTGNNTGQEGEQLSYRSAKKVFEEAGEEVDGNFKTNPHAFRKSRATYLAKKDWNAAMLCQFFGWNDFETAKYYIRLVDKDLESVMWGDQQEEDVEDLTPIQCVDCGEKNPGVRDYCQGCGNLLSTEKELMRHDKQNEVEHEVKDEVIESLTEEFDLPEDRVEQKIRERMRERLEKKGFL